MALSKEEIALELIKLSGALDPIRKTDVSTDEKKKAFAKDAVTLFYTVLDELNDPSIYKKEATPKASL